MRQNLHTHPVLSSLLKGNITSNKNEVTVTYHSNHTNSEQTNFHIKWSNKRIHLTAHPEVIYVTTCHCKWILGHCVGSSTSNIQQNCKGESIQQPSDKKLNILVHNNCHREFEVSENSKYHHCDNATQEP